MMIHAMNHRIFIRIVQRCPIGSRPAASGQPGSFYPAREVSQILSNFNGHLPLSNTTIRFAGRRLNMCRRNVKKW